MNKLFTLHAQGINTNQRVKLKGYPTEAEAKAAIAGFKERGYSRLHILNPNGLLCYRDYDKADQLKRRPNKRKAAKGA
jgi:hypothetical protein